MRVHVCKCSGAHLCALKVVNAAVLAGCSFTFARAHVVVVYMRMPSLRDAFCTLILSMPEIDSFFHLSCMRAAMLGGCEIPHSQCALLQGVFLAAQVG